MFPTELHKVLFNLSSFILFINVFMFVYFYVILFLIQKHLGSWKKNFSLWPMLIFLNFILFSFLWNLRQPPHQTFWPQNIINAVCNMLAFFFGSCILRDRIKKRSISHDQPVIPANPIVAEKTVWINYDKNPIVYGEGI